MTMQIIVNPEDFGGIADGSTINTQSIQAALSQAQGGGTVVLKSGIWLSGPINLPSDVTLHLEEGAILRATNKNSFVDAYIGYETKPNEAFLLGNKVSKVKITGSGVIDGSGEQLWWSDAIELRNALRAGNSAPFEAKYPGIKLANGMPRPWLMEFSDCSDITIEGVSLINSPMWNLVIRNSQDITITGIKINAPTYSPNTDGIDIISSSRVLIKDSEIFTGDDNIAIKSGVDQNGAAPSKDIVVENCTLYAGHGMSIGSETANGIGKVMVRNLKFKDTENGIRIKSARDRGNAIGPLEVEDVVMEQVQTPILVTCSYAGQSGANGLTLVSPIAREALSPTTPYIKGVKISRLKARGAEFAALLSGLPESPVLDVQLEDLDIQSQKGIQARYVSATLINTKVQVCEGDSLVMGPDAKVRETR